MEAIVLAGGLGTRLRKVVADVPKPMAPIAGRPFLEYLLDYWHRQGVRRFVISVGYKRELIQRHFGGRYQGVVLDYAVEEQAAGTGGGLLLAVERLKSDGPVLVMNGDTFFGLNLAAFRAFHDHTEADVSVALYHVGDADRYTPVDVADDGRIRSMQPTTKSRNGVLINGGVYLVGRKVLNRYPHQSPMPLSLEQQLFPDLMKGGAGFFGYVATAPFIDIGVPEDYLRADGVLRDCLPLGA